jgi:NADPH:quinone reductase-like Zn-dependent oxidoreductase
MFRLNGKTVVVIGGSAGMGLATAQMANGYVDGQVLGLDGGHLSIP